MGKLGVTTSLGAAINRTILGETVVLGGLVVVAVGRAGGVTTLLASLDGVDLAVGELCELC